MYEPDIALVCHTSSFAWFGEEELVLHAPVETHSAQLFRNFPCMHDFLCVACTAHDQTIGVCDRKCSITYSLCGSDSLILSFLH